jgi:hypothetical protein
LEQDFGLHAGRQIAERRSLTDARPQLAQSLTGRLVPAGLNQFGRHSAAHQDALADGY